jgi:Tfp pilus assembly protein PilF
MELLCMRVLPLIVGTSLAAALLAVGPAVANSPAEALVAAGFEHLRGHRPSKAESSFREALKADRSVAGAYFGRAMVAAREENFARAVTYFEREIKQQLRAGDG